MYAGKKLKIAPYADIPYEFRPDGRFSEMVQATIDATERWETGENPVQTTRFACPIRPVAVSVGTDAPIWGVHKGHKARKPGLSPFLSRWIDLELLGYITIELEGDSRKPLLTRAYGGDYTPPLPWMSSAQDAIGGRAASRKYWTTHAYLNRPTNLILPGTQTSEVPSWYGTE
jgi:hypothetical protein